VEDANGFEPGWAVSAWSVPGEDERRAQRLVALRTQRMLVTGLREEVEATYRLVSVAGVAGVGAAAGAVSGWRSEAQRRYAERREELRLDLTRVRRQLADLSQSVDREITESTTNG
jgi:hypothetical protein